MLRLGHIEYSNTVPVHALLLDERHPDVAVTEGVPTEINAALAERRVDVAPSSSIEYARHADSYRILPGFCIGSRGPVGSVLLESTLPPGELDALEVALPTASATSVVLVRLLLERAHGVRPRYRWFDQAGGEDPFATGADAALWIGDMALRRDPAERRLLDMGTAWREWTGLPFVFAVWQTSAPAALDPELARLAALLRRSREYFELHAERLAHRYATRFGVAPERLLAYWLSLEYELDGEMQEGLLHFFEMAADLGEAPAVRTLRWV